MLRSRYQIELFMSASAKVSVIVLSLNRSSLTCDCVKAVIENTEAGSYDLIVVDNGSSAEEAERLVLPQSVALLRFNRNMFFGEANNIATERSDCEYIVFLNNDVKVTSGWLAGMLAVYDSHARVGAVGPQFLFPDGSLQEAGAYILPEGGTVQLRTALPTLSSDGIHVVDYCSAACLLMKRKDFLGLGGFDPIFDPAYFEDVDLAVRLRSVGLFSYCCSHVAVFHEQNATSRQIWTADQLSNYFDTNRQRFSARWGDYLQRRMYEPCEPEALPPVAWQAEAAPTGKARMIVYSADPINASEGSRRLLLTACAFQHSHDIIIAADEIISRCRVYSLCREFGIELASFRSRNISDVAEIGNDLVVTFGVEGDTRGRFKSQITFERDGDRLIGLLD